MTAEPKYLYPLPMKGEIARYILTCAQPHAPVDESTWANLQALAKHWDAEIIIGQVSYGTKDPSFDKRLVPFLADVDIELAPGLVWCGRQQISPTIKRPLSGYEALTGRQSCIIPHTQFAMKSVASGKHEPTKLMYTTGSVTKPAFLLKKAGMIAEVLHGFGGLVAEVDSDGHWYVRQLQNLENQINDIGVSVNRGVVKVGQVSTAAIVWGDIHCDRLDPVVRELAWGSGGIIDVLRPRYQLFHDLLDFRSRNHHEAGNPHDRFFKHVHGLDLVAQELKTAADFLRLAERPWSTSVVVEGNHDRHLERWLKETDVLRSDPANALVWCELQIQKLNSLMVQGVDFHLLETALKSRGCPEDTLFLRTDDTLVINGVECGMHGDLGANGSRGSPNGMTKLCRPMITGHTHVAGIVEGVYTTGTSSSLDMGYNRGPSSWSHSHVILYPNGGRAIITQYGGKWRAEV